MSQQTLDKIIEEVEHREQPLTYEVLGGRGVREIDRIVEGFLSVLSRMTREERISASRHGGFNRWERWVWAAHYLEEVPLINGELEWIALAVADLD